MANTLRKTLFSIILCALIAWSPLATTTAISAEQNCEQEFALLQKRIKGNKFVTSRSLIEYKSAFSVEFGDTLNSLKESDHWVDSGAGKARALQDYLLGKKATSSTPAQTTGIVYESPSLFHTFKLSSLSKNTNGHFRYLSGRFLENIPSSEIGNAKLITDYFGPLSYSTQADQVLAKYLEILEPNGKIFIISGFGTSIKDHDTVYSLGSWIKSILPSASFRVEEGKHGIMIEKLNDNAFQVPKLKLKLLQEGAPPYRQFEVCIPGKTC